MFHFHLIHWILITAAICAVASILSRILPKKGVKVTQTISPDTAKAFEQHTALDSLLNDSEKASLTKFFQGFTQLRNWFKALAFGIMIAIIFAISYGVYTDIKSFFIKKAPPVNSTITNTGGGKVEAKTESSTNTQQSNGLNLNIFSGWFK